ncbi:two-component sensor histidine kinase [Hanstruepera neustonica]|uniref:histidine kinase n=1 Tax=Hanstruepera neustonica TaxID=1445657 RepID=A0A2K1E0W3_9FLAO|nr:HAMP domain-containing sensor histidine kinase [Hanstruepera neustonica]PNQ73930.1 two-component sensor histidine kinase [Hanstruepera neustonica]
MNNVRYGWILNTIVIVAMCTIAIQVYWNYKNYLINKQQLINDVQISLDNAVDSYYAKIAKQNTLAFAFSVDDSTEMHNHHKQINDIIKHIDIDSDRDSLKIEIFDDVSYFGNSDTVQKKVVKKWQPIKLEMGTDRDFSIDSLTQDSFKMLTSKVIYSMTNDTLKLEQLDSLVKTELTRKNLNIDYGLLFKSPIDSFTSKQLDNIKLSALKTTSKSTYLPKGSELEIYFSNATALILKRIMLGIFVSLLLVLSVIGCLMYLLKIIKHQKQLAEVKNDLISNITHEFKTPIATISVALESIKNFNTKNDPEKTKSYLEMSSNQLEKLNTMVEKLLETATLDSEEIDLNKESCDMIPLLESLMAKYQIQAPHKTLTFIKPQQEITVMVDVFHFENAISNVIDNAVKYGGETITVSIQKTAISLSISISDNGASLNNESKNHIFEKFYRVPKGNTHDVKGFGIGLYYTKKIIEKHGGLITLHLEPKLTTFKITLPNV